MREFAKSYLGELIDNFRSFEVSDVKGEKFDVYETLPFAETGNSFGKIDV